MATYKVLQDIEAEDKLVGPFSLRQFIYAAIAIVSAFIAFKLITVSVFFIFPFAPVVILFGVLAAPFGRDQPSEIWLLAKIRFVLKPHRRIWNQDGAINLVSVTAPKSTDKQLTKNLTPNEVSSRLKALANTIDSRGWAVKNVNVNLGAQTQPLYGDVSSQRLIDPGSLPQDVPSVTVTAADDILDPISNPTAQHFEEMINASDQAHRKKVIDSVTNPVSVNQTAQAPADYWFMNNATPTGSTPKGYSDFYDSKIVQPGEDASKYAGATPTIVDTAILNKIKPRGPEEEAAFRAQHHISSFPGEQAPPVDETVTDDNPPRTAPANPDIINLALANKDNWSVATAQHEAEKASKKQEPPLDEVVINLH